MSKNRSNSVLGSGNTNTLPKKQEGGKKRWALTLFYENEKEYKDLISSFSSNNFKYIIGREICPTTKKKHLQIYIESPKKIRFTALKKLNDKLHIEEAKGNRESNINYCSKEGNFETNFKFKVPVKILKDEELRPFQISLLKIILGDVFNHKIHWLYDPKGQCGKTAFLKYCNVKYNIPFCYGGKCSDIINIAFNNRQYLEYTDKPCFIFNICRDTEDDNYKGDIISYSALEQLSDGMIANNKYEGWCGSFNDPHILVFSNDKPKLSKLSKGRFILYTINENYELIKL